MTRRDTLSSDELCTWLARAALAGEPVETILAGFVRRLNAGGLGIGRAYLGIRLLHPLIKARGYIYRRGEDAVSGEEYAHAQMPDGYHESPIEYMLRRNVRHLHRALRGPAAELDFPLLRHFAAQGYSAWLAHLIPFNFAAAVDAPERAAKQDEPFGFIFTLCCDQPEGWGEADRKFIESLLPPLGAAMQGRVFATFAQDLLATYLGGDAARQVLEGTITRGRVRRLRAAILYADLRGFTRRAEAIEPAVLVGTLDRHFDRLVEPVMAQGGQVLKFMGDGLLAVFPAGSGDDGDGSVDADAGACHAALSAAQQAIADIAALAETEMAAMPVDIALHLGDVLYGNVGGSTRLDFTVIGPAVNEAARMERKCEELGTALILSSAVAACLSKMTPSLRSLGRHELRGIAGERELFTLAYFAASRIVSCT